MFLYRVKYTESEYNIQNNDLLYKTHQQYQNTFEFLETIGTIRKTKKIIKKNSLEMNQLVKLCGPQQYIKYTKYTKIQKFTKSTNHKI